MSVSPSRRGKSDPARDGVPVATGPRADLQATHYRHFAEAAATAALSLTGGRPVAPRRWSDDEFSLRVEEDGRILLCVQRPPEGLPWRLVFRRTRTVRLELRLAEADYVLCIGARAHHAEPPPAAPLRRGGDALRLDVISARFLRENRDLDPPPSRSP